MALPILLLVAVLGYAVYAMQQAQQWAANPSSADPQTAALESQGATQPLNPSAPIVVAETLQPTPGSKRGTIIFDMSHTEVFGPQDTSDLGQSKAVAQMRAAGYAVKVNTAKLESKDSIPADVAAVFLPGPMVPFTDKERANLDDFVRRGGTMIMTIHVPFPIIGTPARYGLPVGTGVMVDPAIATDPGVWVTDQIKKDPVTAGVKKIKVVSGWAVSTSPSDIADPRIIISAPKRVVVDGNGDGVFNASDPQPPYGVVGVASIGSGRVVVMGDDAIFANIAIDTNDNAKLLSNILELISAPKPV
jgi:hypothetical protein